MPEIPANLLQADGSVLIPASVAGDVIRFIVLGLTDRVRTDGGEVSTSARRVLWALHEAAQRQDEAGFPDETPPPAQVTVEMTACEVAAVMGCSPQYVRRLCASGVLRARRAGRQWMITR